jgi:hypothetical protein
MSAHVLVSLIYLQRVSDVAAADMQE